jgi:hypothetical protein
MNGESGKGSRKVALFTFCESPGCFIHMLLNAIDMKQRGWDVKVVIEGDSTKLVSLLRNETKMGSVEWHRALQAGVIDCVCKACAQRNGTLPAVIEQGLRLCDEMNGHPAMARYIEDGYEIVTL